MFRKTSIAIIISIAAFAAATTAASAAEIELAGIKLGRSVLSVIQKYGNPNEVRLGARAQQAAQSGGMEMPPPGFGAEMPPPGFGAETPPPGFGADPGGAQQGVGQGSGREVTWIYRFAKNKTLEFIIDPEGRILQIATFGVEWSGLKTSKGISLGSTYKDIILAYGFPESHEQAGIEMRTLYANSHRVGFTLVGNQVVGITIAFMD